MSARFRTALLVVGILAAATVVMWLVLRPGSGPGLPDDDVGTLRGTDDLDAPIVGPLAGASSGGSGDTSAGTTNGVGPGESTGGSTSRTPFGADLRDPSQLRAAILKALGDRPIPWAELARLVPMVDGTLDEEVRTALLHALATGDRANALRVFVVVRDGTLVRDLFGLLDQPDLTPGAKSAILEALARMPGANAAEVVRGLEARLTGVGRRDLAALQAIGRRGGRDGARAILEYMMRSDTPRDLPAYGFLGLSLGSDDVAAQVIADAMASAPSEDVLRALVALSAQPGADVLVPSLVALDAGDTSPQVRREALQALARIGSDEAVAHLLDVGSRQGTYAEAAIEELGTIRSATPEARERLLADLAATARNPDATTKRAALLSALGNLQEPQALESLVDALVSPDAATRHIAVRGLGNLGEASRPHIDTLLDLFATGDEPMQRRVAVSLGGIGGPSAKSALEAMLTNPDLVPTVRRTARMALQRARRTVEEGPQEEGPSLGGR